MAGEIRRMIDTIIEKRSNGNQVFTSSTKVKMIMKGIFPDKFNEDSDDDPVVMQKLQDIAKELNINL